MKQRKKHMKKDIKHSVIKLVLIGTIIPLLIFSIVFFGQTFQFFMNRDTENIHSVLEREQKYLSYLVDYNIKDMLVVSTSDNIKTQRVNEIMEVFERVMKVRGDFYKMKYVRRDGYTVEVVRGQKGIEYTKRPIGIIERICIENGEFATYSNGEEMGQYIVFSAPFKIDGKIEAVVLGYLPAKNLNFITSNINLNALGNIYIKDSRDNFLIRHGSNFISGNKSIEYKIQNTDWTLWANIDYSYFKDIIYKNILIKLLVFLILIVIFLLPFALYAGNYLRDIAGKIINSTKAMKKLEDENDIPYGIEEIGEFRKSYNKLIDAVNSNIKVENDKACVDRLTGLYNKMYIEDKLIKAMNEIEGENSYFLTLEIWNSAGNGQTGQSLAWDVIIAEIGEVIRESVRFRDIAIRLGEDKFFIVLRNIDRGKSMEIAGRLKDIIKNKFSNVNGSNVSLRVNIGVSKFNGDVYSTLSTCERALYEAKSSKTSKIKYRES